jgi:hypothetical protein
MMLISKRSRRKSTVFESQFRDGRGGDFPVRQYLRCREDFSSGLVHTALTLAFIVTLVIFGQTLARVFDTQGAHLNPWYKRAAMVLMGLFVLSVLRRLYYKVMELREIRREMAHLKAGFRDRDEESAAD